MRFLIVCIPIDCGAQQVEFADGSTDVSVDHATDASDARATLEAGRTHYCDQSPSTPFSKDAGLAETGPCADAPDGGCTLSSTQCLLPSCQCLPGFCWLDDSGLGLDYFGLP